MCFVFCFPRGRNKNVLATGKYEQTKKRVEKNKVASRSCLRVPSDPPPPRPGSKEPKFHPDGQRKSDHLLWNGRAQSRKGKKNNELRTKPVRQGFDGAWTHP